MSDLLADVPSHAYRRWIEIAIDHFASAPGVDAVLLVGSGARGKAAKDLDLCILVRPDSSHPGPARDERHDPQLQRLYAGWMENEARAGVETAIAAQGTDHHVDIGFTDGCFAPVGRGWTSWPEAFELEIGNHLAHARPLAGALEYFGQLRQRWLPYYDDALRRERLRDVVTFGLNNLDHAISAARRGLVFHAFSRLYHAHQELIQALFMARRIYPIAYDKWIHEQIVEMLGLPDVYAALERSLALGRLGEAELVERAGQLRLIFETEVQRAILAVG